MAMAAVGSAHEADQYTYPEGRQFADIGDYLTRVFYDAIEKGVNKTNSHIASATKFGNSTELKGLESLDEVAHAVNREFPVALFMIEDIDRMAQTPEARQKYPG